MKKLPLIALALLSVSALNSCKKEKKSDTQTATTGTPSLQSLAFKLNGTTYAVSASQMVQHTSGKIFISTSSNPNESISISVSDTLTVGSYNFGPNGSDAFRMFYTPDNYATAYTSVSGTGTIVSHDMANNKIQATFSCMLVSNGTTPDTIYVTNGELNKSYPQ